MIVHVDWLVRRCGMFPLLKTKVIKNGGWEDSIIPLCQELKLEWSQKIVSLGITDDIENFDHVTDINLEEEIKEIPKPIFI